jgi:hypothetical protein
MEILWYDLVSTEFYALAKVTNLMLEPCPPMKPNQVYFCRNRGSWNWQVKFEIKSWRNFWGANIPIFSKLSLSVLALIQRIFGPLRLWTNVDFQEATNVVYHSTKMRKFGLTVYHSEKKFTLLEDGHGLQLEGAEY